MNDKHRPAGSKDENGEGNGGQFAPKDGEGSGEGAYDKLAKALGFENAEAAGFDLRKQLKIDSAFHRASNPPLGEYSPEIQKAANSLHDNAVRNEETIRRDVQYLAKILDGKMVGLDYVVKSPESIAKKIRSGIEDYHNTWEDAIGNVDDLVRYTVMFPHGEIVEKTRDFVDSLISKGYRYHYFQNRYLPATKDGSMQEGYRDMNIRLIAPNGSMTEIQFMIPEMYAAKMGKTIDGNGNFVDRTDGIRPGHDYYDMSKALKSMNMPKEERDERERYLAFMNMKAYEMAGTIPAGIEGLRREIWKTG